MKKSEALAVIDERVRTCAKCSILAETRTQTVFGEGSTSAKILLLGEAPGADEDASGRPFIGKAGVLLNQIIEACGWKRDEVFICNILKCRPPNNRNPHPDEAKNCRKFLDLQINIVNPTYIVCLGKIAAYYFLNVETPFEKTKLNDFRGKIIEKDGRKIIATYHPAYLLRNPKSKPDVWNDLQIVIRDIYHENNKHYGSTASTATEGGTGSEASGEEEKGSLGQI